MGLFDALTLLYTGEGDTQRCAELGVTGGDERGWRVEGVVVNGSLLLVVDSKELF